MRRRDLLALPIALRAQSPIALTGLAELPAAPLALQAGPLSLLFEPALGFVRYLRFGEHEVLRGIYAAVRDRNWGTVPPQLSNLRTATSPDGFTLEFDVLCRQGDIDFAWQGKVTGQATGILRFDFQGQARSTFERNRIGFCVLHPLAECAGKPCRAEQGDGQFVTGQFPDLISPHQPLLNLRALSHQLPDGTDVEVRFSGDTFEMEDHRNWTDGNYKTYCTPLALPYPVKVTQGTRIEQSVTVTLKPKGAPRRALARSSTVELTAAERTGKLPTLGFGIATRERPLGAREAALLLPTRPAHLRIDLHLGAPDWRTLLHRAKAEATALQTRLEIAVTVGANAEAELQALAQEAAKPARWLIYHADSAVTPPATIALARKVLPGPLAAGTNQYFTELNRDRPTLTALDAVCYTLNPQVHAFDNASLIENLSPQADQLRSARRFCAAKPLLVSPVTLRPRFNPQQRGPEPPPAPHQLPARIDHRQPSLFAAAWTLGSLKYLSEAGAASITYYETHGWGGLLMAGASPLPDLFPATPGMVFPLFHVFADFADFAGGTFTELRTDSPLEALGLQLSLGPRRRTLIANLTAQPRLVRLPAAPKLTIRTLDDRSFALATTQPERYRRTQQTLLTNDPTVTLPLGPYAILTLDSSSADRAIV